MIQSKQDYEFYLQADRIALNITSLKKPRIFQDEIWRFQRLLRMVEFLGNCKTNGLRKIPYDYARFRLQKLSVKLGFTISPKAFGPGLSIAHRGPIIVNPDVRIGENCRIHQCVTIGSVLSEGEVASYGYKTPKTMSPRIGNNVFIGPGAVIIGGIEIADGIAIGANAYVNKSLLEPNITVAGCPAKKISDKGSKYCWFRATEILRAETNKN